MRTHQKLILVTGKHRFEKIGEILNLIGHEKACRATRNEVGKLPINPEKPQHIDKGELRFMHTKCLSDAQHDSLLAVIEDSDDPVTVLYSGDKARTTLLDTLLDAGANVRDMKTRTMLTTKTPGKVRHDTIESIHEYYRTQRITDLNRSWDAGAPPFGFSSENGELVEDPWFNEIQETLKAVQEGDLTQKRAAEELGCTRKTIRKCLDNSQRYRI